VRVALAPEKELKTDGPETFRVVATNAGGKPSPQEEGVGTIFDNGSGNYFAEENTTGNPGLPQGQVLDDDRPLTVTDITVHESLGFAVFTVTGASNQQVSLRTEEATAKQNDYGPGIEYFNGVSWVPYVDGFITLPESGQLQVRVPLVNDGIEEGTEIFQLVASNTGGGDYAGTARVPDRVVELYVMEGTTVISPYSDYFNGFSSYGVVGGVDAGSYVDTGSVNLAFLVPAVYATEVGADNQYPVVAEATAPGNDPDQVLFIVNVMSYKAIKFTPLTELRLDRQSGLYKQQIEAENLHAHAIHGFRFQVTLIPGATLFNSKTDARAFFRASTRIRAA
jgi:hypothetical protein